MPRLCGRPEKTCQTQKESRLVLPQTLCLTTGKEKQKKLKTEEQMKLIDLFCVPARDFAQGLGIFRICFGFVLIVKNKGTDLGGVLPLLGQLMAMNPGCWSLQ